MATAASFVTEQPKKRHIRKRAKRSPSLIVFHGNKQLSAEDGDVLLLHISAAMANRRAGMGRRYERIAKLPTERRSIERAMLVVEEAFVKAMWVLQMSGSGDGPEDTAGNNGIAYRTDDADRFGQAVTAGGWIMPAPRPALPSSKEITAAENAHLWVRYLEPLAARVLTVGAMSKRGDAGRRINWERVRPRLPELGGYTVRHLQGVYTAALREIVTMLSTNCV